MDTVRTAYAMLLPSRDSDIEVRVRFGTFTLVENKNRDLALGIKTELAKHLGRLPTGERNRIANQFNVEITLVDSIRKGYTFKNVKHTTQ